MFQIYIFSIPLQPSDLGLCLAIFGWARSGSLVELFACAEELHIGLAIARLLARSVASSRATATVTALPFTSVNLPTGKTVAKYEPNNFE